MKIVIAIDSFKGSLTSLEAGKAAESGIRKVMDAEVIVKPLADGGEGTTEALVAGLGGEMISLKVTGPLMEPVDASYGYIDSSKTAIIEMASAAGITYVKEGEKNPLKSTTFGVGEMIKDAVNRGCREFIIGLGGSATNDCGIGMLSALGFEFLDEDGCPVGIDANALEKVNTISTQSVLPELKDCQFNIACDVTNPLCGENGATYIYGPQKGVKNEMREQIDLSVLHFAEVTKLHMNNDFKDTKGAGAAGGLGFAFLSYFNATLQPGIELVLKATELEKCIENADIVITGEGRLDGQTAMGKAPVGVAKLAKKYGATVIALAGSILDGAERCNEEGIDAYFPILNRIITLEEAMNKEVAISNMAKTTEQIFRLIQSTII